jgi:hypothetical protein
MSQRSTTAITSSVHGGVFATRTHAGASGAIASNLIACDFDNEIVTRDTRVCNHRYKLLFSYLCVQPGSTLLAIVCITRQSYNGMRIILQYPKYAVVFFTTYYSSTLCADLDRKFQSSKCDIVSSICLHRTAIYSSLNEANCRRQNRPV